MLVMLSLLLLCTKIATVTAKIPDGFILDIQVDCGDASNGSYALVTVKSDMVVKIEFDCGSGSANALISGIRVEASVNVYYGADTENTGDCYFKSPDPDSGLTTVKVKMYYGLEKDNLVSVDETYTVSCLTKPNENETTEGSFKSDGYNPNVISENLGNLTTSTVEFHIVDVADKPLDGINIPIGKKVQLRANVSGDTTDIQITDCLAIGTDNNETTYPILKAGCGDGIIFPNSVGFTSSSGVIRSPYFGLFRLEEDSGVKFSCNFQACQSTCDGSSCTNAARKKRSPSKDGYGTEFTSDASSSQPDDIPFLNVESTSYTLVDPDLPDNNRAYKRTGKPGMVHREDNGIPKPNGLNWTIFVVSALGTLFLGSTAILIFACSRQKRQS